MPDNYLDCEVKVLMGEKGLNNSLKCLKSLVKSLGIPSLNVHLDGFFSDEAKRRVDDSLGIFVNFIERKETDCVILDKLRKYKNASYFRNTNVMALKLFDINFFGEADDYLYFDTDIFFRNKVNVKSLLAMTGPLFMEDTYDSYSVRPWDLKPLGSLSIVSNLCAGFIKFSKSKFNLDLVDWILSKLINSEVGKKRPYWLEQTCWAALAADFKDGGLVGNPFFGFPWKDTKKIELEKYDAIHFVSTFRDKLELFDGTEMCEFGQPIIWKAKEFRKTNPMKMAFSDLSRRLTRKI